MWVLSVQSLGNQYRQLSFHTKAIRAFRERPGSLLALLENPTAVNLLAADGRLLPSASFEIDLLRFNRCMAQIGKALYFKETRKKWCSDCEVFSNLFHAMTGTGSHGLNERHQEAVAIAEKALAPLPRKGQNPEVFSYRFSAHRPDLIVLLMTYYEEIKVLVTLRVNLRAK